MRRGGRIITQQLTISVIGGCGRVGLPLSIALADRGAIVHVVDKDPVAVAAVRSGMMPFDEPGAPEILDRLVREGRLAASTDPAGVAASDVVVIVVGTAAGEHGRSTPGTVVEATSEILSQLRSGQLILLRSTLAPGTTAQIEALVKAAGLEVDVATCPERIAEGHAMSELFSLPQLIGARSATGRRKATEVFELLGCDPVHLTPEQAELAKLFANVWRYVSFAASNQLYMIANSLGEDFGAIRSALTYGYPRAAGLPAAGFAAGPCLVKDTDLVGEVSGDIFSLGSAAISVNEGLPRYLIDRLGARYNLAGLKVGILGMAFKAGSDDIRSSLAYVMKSLLEERGAQVLCTDPYVKSDPGLVPLQNVIDECQVLVVGAPHKEYLNLDVGLPAVDPWNVLGLGTYV